MQPGALTSFTGIQNARLRIISAMSEAGLMLDPLNLKFKFYFEDFPQDPMFLHSGSISVAGTSFSSSLSTRVGIPK